MGLRIPLVDTSSFGKPASILSLEGPSSGCLPGRRAALLAVPRRGDLSGHGTSDLFTGPLKGGLHVTDEVGFMAVSVN